MPGKPPYFPLYVADIESDGNCEAMTTEQFGAYMRLLCKAWHQEPTGSVPNDDAILSRWARLSLKRWLSIKDGVLKPFDMNGDGRLYQKRMVFEFDKLIKRVLAGSKGGLHRQAKFKQTSSKRQAKSKQMLSDSESNSESLHFVEEGTGGNGRPPGLLPTEFCGSPAFVAAFDAWLKHRREIKRPLTPSTMARQCKKLVEWGLDKAISSIEQSIENGWVGLFEPGGASPSRPQKAAQFSGIKQWLEEKNAVQRS